MTDILRPDQAEILLAPVIENYAKFEAAVQSVYGMFMEPSVSGDYSPIFAANVVNLVPDIIGSMHRKELADAFDVKSFTVRATTDEVSTRDFELSIAAVDMLSSLEVFAVNLGLEQPRRKQKSHSERNPAQHALARMEPLSRWMDDIPSAFALEPLYDSRTLLRYTDFSSIEEMDADSKKEFLESLVLIENCIDGVGIRSRGAVTQNAIYEVSERVDSTEAIKVLSLAAGAGVSVFRAAADLIEHGRGVNITLVDNDPEVLDLARINSGHLGLIEGKDVFFIEGNILDTSALDKVLERQKFHIVEAIGIEEYFPDRMAAALISDMVSRLEPTGEAIFANMTSGDTRKNLDFTLKVVGWPLIIPRSTADVVDIVKRAGVNNRLNLSVETTSDQLYNLYRITP